MKDLNSYSDDMTPTPSIRNRDVVKWAAKDLVRSMLASGVPQEVILDHIAELCMSLYEAGKKSRKGDTNMKKLALLLTTLLLAVPVSAGTIQGGATVRTDGTRNPVEGFVSLEQSALRLSLSAGNERRFGSGVDLIGRTSAGLVFGVGVVADGLTDSDYTAESSNVTTVKPHDKGKHKGDKHVRKGKVVVLNRSRTFTVGGMDYVLVPSVLLGVSGRHAFVESRVLFDDDAVSNRVSVGVRF